MRLVFLILVALIVTACGSSPTASTLTGQGVVDAFKAAGLEAESPQPMTEDDYGMSAITADEGIRFLVPSICPDCGGRVMIFNDPEKLQAMKGYYLKVEEVAGQKSWLYENGPVLVQINGDLPEEQAKKYEAALTGLQ